MNWSQLILSAGSISFTIALIPSIISQNKPHGRTSFITAFWLTLYLLVYIHLHYWFTFVCGSTTALGWWVLFAQKYREAA